MADSPFYQPARQNFSSSQSMQQPQGGFGGFGGGFQQQSWGGGFGGNQGFGGFGGGGFQPQGFGFGGGFGGFQPQQQFNPYQGGFGGGFNPYQGGFGGFGGFGGGYNPMFGGIGGLGFNPMMGPQFGMPMQGFGGMGAAAAQAQRTPIQFDEKMPTEQDWNLHAASAFYAPNTDMEAMKRDFMSRPMRTPRNLETPQQFVQASPESIARVQQFQSQFQPMYGGIGGLGFNPMMGPQFGMPMLQGMQANSPQGRAAMGSLGGMNIQPMSAEQQQLLSQLPQQTQASPSGSSFAQLAQMFGGRVPQTSSEPQQPAPPGMKWMLGYGGHSLVPAGMDTSMMG